MAVAKIQVQNSRQSNFLVDKLYLVGAVMILESLLELLEPLPESKNLVRTESLFSNNLRSMLLAVLRRRLLSFVKKQKKNNNKNKQRRESGY